MKFTLEIELGNDGMQTPGDIAKALERAACGLSYWDDVADINRKGTIRDLNGNTVGKWQVFNTCTECGEPSDNGEGWNGLCGSCADRDAA